MKRLENKIKRQGDKRKKKEKKKERNLNHYKT